LTGESIDEYVKKSGGQLIYLSDEEGATWKKSWSLSSHYKEDLAGKGVKEAEYLV
jgi:hypothetical protein